MHFFAHILVVDDDDGIRSLVKKYLNENNYLVTTANSAEDATKIIKIVHFDLIILANNHPKYVEVIEGEKGIKFNHRNDNKIIFDIRSSFETDDEIIIDALKNL